MKNILFILIFCNSLCASSQNIKKTFLCILDTYIKTEILKNGLDKDSLIINIRLDKIDKNFEISLETYELSYFPNIDTIKKYKNIRVLIRYPKGLQKQLSKYFKPIREIRKLKKENKITVHEFKSNCLFQINDKNEFTIISTTNDQYYYKILKENKLKFAKKLKFTRDLS